jgi:2'-5' RNA ligase
MAHAIEMFLDAEADTEVRRLWAKLADAGLPSMATRTHRRHRPHVTLTVAESLAHADLSEVRQVLRGGLVDLDLYTLAKFPTDEGVLFLGVVVTGSLLALHARVHEALRGQPVTHWPYYLPDRWVPHCGLAQDVDRESMAAAVSLLYDVKPINAKVVSVGVTDTATGDVTLLTG